MATEIETAPSHLLLHNGGRMGRSSGREHGLLRLSHAFAPLLLEALFATRLADLHHVILSPPPALLRIDGHLVAIAAHLRPLARPQRHLGRDSARTEGSWTDRFRSEIAREMRGGKP